MVDDAPPGRPTPGAGWEAAERFFGDKPKGD
jgi:hypothetical protein